jgi:hypothetical protein
MGKVTILILEQHLNIMKGRISIMKQEERLLQWVVCGWDEETLERDESWFQGAFKPVSYEDLATIQMLRDDVKRQLKELEEGSHADGYLIAWGEDGEVLITQNGAYIWDEESLDYKQVLIGMIYEKEWYNEHLPIEYRKRKDYFAIVVYE